VSWKRPRHFRGGLTCSPLCDVDDGFAMSDLFVCVGRKRKVPWSVNVKKVASISSRQ
jgi:hypothetical protein